MGQDLGKDNARLSRLMDFQLYRGLTLELKFQELEQLRPRNSEWW